MLISVSKRIKELDHGDEKNDRNGKRQKNAPYDLGEDPDREPVPAIVGVIITIHGCNITHDFDTIYEDGDPVDLNVYREYVVQPLEGTAYHSMSLDDYEPYWIYQDLDDLFNEFYETYPNGVIWGYGTGWVDDHLVGPEIVGFVG